MRKKASTEHRAYRTDKRSRRHSCRKPAEGQLTTNNPKLAELESRLSKVAGCPVTVDLPRYPRWI